ncbi:MAG TPA: flagellar biosynthetic protein FliO, partial [Telluria sp.]
MMRGLLSLLVLVLPLALAPAHAQGGAPAPAPETSGAAPSAAKADVAAPNTAANARAAATNATPIPNTGPVTMPSASPTGSLLQTLFALIVVLGVLAVLAWLLRRYGPRAIGANANVKIVGSLNLGGRERLLVVEVGNQWIVVGASPGRVNGLA